MKYLMIALAALFSLTLSTPAAYADSDPIYTSWRNNTAVGGFDSVSFFSGKPLEGNKDFAAEYKGATWYFATRANLDLFTANPEAFAPQYGGYCAWALAQGKLAKGSPKHWTVLDGRLFLNFNARVQRDWEADKDDFIIDADKRWPNILMD